MAVGSLFHRFRGEAERLHQFADFVERQRRMEGVGEELALIGGAVVGVRFDEMVEGFLVARSQEIADEEQPAGGGVGYGGREHRRRVRQMVGQAVAHHDVELAQVGWQLFRVGVDQRDAVGELRFFQMFSSEVEHAGSGFDRRHVAIGEPPAEGDRDQSSAGAEIKDG